MNLTKKLGIVLIMVFMTAAMNGYCLSTRSTAAISYSAEEFLNINKLKVTGEPDKFNVVVPKSWEVKLGAYPIGLYWRLANEYSKDIGLDLTAFKGKSVEVLRYNLEDGLPGFGDQSKFKYPSTVVLLLSANKVVGAWLGFNMYNVGPSIKKRYLKDITGLSYDEWVKKEGLFLGAGKNGDLAAMEPIDLLKAFFKAINAGDRTRAYACIDPNELLGALTTNLPPHCLYNSGFSKNNSIVDNISKAIPISFSMMDAENFSKIKKINGQKQVEIEVALYVLWRKNEFTSPDTDGNTSRFAILKKYENGWKLYGLGTGP